MTPLGALEASALGQAIRDWLPVVKAVHLSGVALLLGSILVVDLRLLGVWPEKSVKQLTGKLLP